MSRVRERRTRDRELRAQRRLMDEEAEDLAPPGDEEALRTRATHQMEIRTNFLRHAIASGVVIAVLFAVFAAIGLVEPLTMFVPWLLALVWGTRLVTEGLDTYYATGARAAQRTAEVHQALADAYGTRWYRDASLPQQRIVRARVLAPWRRRAELGRQDVYFVLVNGILWAIWATMTPNQPAWPLIPTVLWGFILLMGAMGMRRGQASQPDTIEREVERQRALMEAAEWAGEKPKNDFLDADADLDGPAMTVGPDGELVELTEEPEAETDEDAKRKRA
ncbi:MAG: 2TM domain-containing protein [Anaerolineae bacterium]